MKLRSQSLSVIVIATTALLFMATLLVGTIQMARFRKLEVQQLEDLSIYMTSVAEKMLEAQLRLNEDWSWWDATYDFARNKDLSYIDENIPPESLWDNGLTLIAVFDDDGVPIWTALRGKERPAVVTIPNPIIHSIREILTDQIQDEDCSLSGYGVLPILGITAITASSILQNDCSGPSAGWMVMVSIPDKSWFTPSRETAEVRLIPEDGMPERSFPENIFQDRVYLTVDLPEIKGTTSVKMVVDRPSHLIHAGESLLLWCILALVISSLIVGSGTLLWLDRKFFKRLESLEKQASRDTPLLLDDYQDDEIGTLCKAFNNLLRTRKRESLEDVLTGLENRRALEEKLADILDKSLPEKLQVGLIMVDLNGFKAINDRFGHSVGDRLLKEVSLRFLSVMDGKNSIARIGGDEFSAVVVGQDDIFSSTMAQSERILNSLREPFAMEDSSLLVSASLGIAFYPKDGETPDSLFRSADSAMYRAKRRGLGIAVYDEKKDGVDEESTKLDKNIREAMEKDAFHPHYLPEFHIQRDKGLRAIKVVPRCDELEGLPYMERAENTGIATQIDLAVLRKAIKEKPLTPLTMDLSSWHLWNGGLSLCLSGMLKDEGRDPSSLELSIDDALLARDVERLTSLLDELSSIGVSLAIRNFGKHYIPIDVLRKLPLKSLKIYPEMTKIDRTEEDLSYFALKTMIGLGERLSLDTVATGIDTEEQLDFVRKAGVSAATGAALG